MTTEHLRRGDDDVDDDSVKPLRAGFPLDDDLPVISLLCAHIFRPGRWMRKSRFLADFFI